MTADLRAHLDRLDTALAEGLAIRPDYPSSPALLQQGSDVLAVWSDGARLSFADAPDSEGAALIVAAVNALPGLLAAVRAAADLADELEEDSRDAMRISADGRERGDREVHRINARHGRVAHHAASAIRTALAALDDQETPDA